MIVARTEIEQINGRIRRRVLRLPVKEGRLGELKRCPLREGGVYHLTHPIPYHDYLQAAQEQPTRARQIIRLLLLCDTPTLTATVTVTAVQRQEDWWLVRFQKGEHRELFDTDIFLARQNDFTVSPSRQTVRGDPPYCPPLADDLRRAREKAFEKRLTPEQQIVTRMLQDADTLARSMASMKGRNRARLIAKELEKLAASSSVEDGATLVASDRAARQAPVDVEDEPRPGGTEPPVSLEPAA